MDQSFERRHTESLVGRDDDLGSARERHGRLPVALLRADGHDQGQGDRHQHGWRTVHGSFHGLNLLKAQVYGYAKPLFGFYGRGTRETRARLSFARRPWRHAE